MENISPEVLIYLQNVKNYFNQNIETKNYFIGENDEELFYQYLTEISQKNFETNGEAMLNKEQFELLRKVINIVKITTLKEEDLPEDKLFFDTDFGKICLN
jgi:hypothetical protein